MQEFTIVVSDFNTPEWFDIESIIKPEQWSFKATDENRAVELFLEKLINHIETTKYFEGLNSDAFLNQISCHVSAKCTA